MGFWGKTALMTGDSPKAPVKRLMAGVKTTFFSALSLFMMLVAFGKLMIRTPSESDLWVWIYLGIALAALPLWLPDILGKPKNVAMGKGDRKG